MNIEIIKTMGAGIEINHLVMTEIFKATLKYYGEDEVWYHFDSNGEPDSEWSSNNNPSHDISAALEIVEKLVRGKLDFTFETEFSYEHYFVRFKRINSDPSLKDGEALEKTFALAICKAALLAVMT